jgi:hypothetical protein
VYRIRLVSNLLLAFAMLAMAPHAAAAKDLSIENLLGRWCGPTADYTFSRTELRVVPHNKQRTLTHGPVLVIDDVEVGDGWINVKWKNAGNTVFWKFSNDGRQMYQHANEEGDHGPQMKFHRC